MMKRLLFILGIVISIQSFGQTPTGYTKFNQKYNFIEVRADSALGFPVRDTFIAPAYIGESRYKTSDSTVYIAIRISGAGKKWQAVGGGTSHTEGYGIDITTGIISVDSSLLLTRLDNYRLLDSISGSINPTLQEVLTNGSTLTTGASIDAGLNTFEVYNAGIINLSAAYEYTLVLQDGSNAATVNATADNLNLSVSEAFNISAFYLRHDSIMLLPPTGAMNIDSLRSWSDIADTAYKKPMTWDTRNGRWEYFNSWPSQNYLALDDIADTLENYGWETDTLTGLFVTEGSPDTLRIDTTDIATRAWVLSQGYGGGAYTADYGLILTGSAFSVDTSWNKIATKAYVDSAVMGGGSSVTFGTTTQIPYMNAGGTDFIYSASLTFDGTNLSSSDVTAADDVFVGDDLVFNSTGDLIDFNGDIQIRYSNTNELRFENGSLYYFDNDILPATNNIVPLGTGLNSFSDLFLGSGAVINFNNGNATITHSAGLLTSSVDVVVPTEVYGAGWNGSNEVPTKDAIYDKIETISGGSVTYGTDNQIPVMNAAGTAFEYSANFTYDGTNVLSGGGFTAADGRYYFNSADLTDNYIDWNNDAASRLTLKNLDGDISFYAGGTNAIYFIKNTTVALAISSGASPYIGIGTIGPDRYLHVEQSDAVTSAVTYVNRLTHITSGTAASGFGVGQEWEIENASGTNKVAGELTYSWSDATNTSEDATFKVRLMAAGTLADALTLTSTGQLTVPSLVVSGNTEILGTVIMSGLGTNAADNMIFITSTGNVVEGAFGSGVELTSGNTFSTKSYALTTNTTDVANVGSGEDNLMTYSVPAGQLATDGDYIEFTMTIQTAVNANAKTVKVYFGSTTLLSLPSLSSAGGYITITGKIIRTGATTQDVEISYVSTNDNQTASFGTAAETLSGALTLKATGEGVADNDIIQKSLTVRYFSN